MSGSNLQGQGPRNRAIERVAGMNLDGSSDRGSVSGSPSRGSQHSRSGSNAGSQAGEGSRSRSGSTAGEGSGSRSGSTAGGPAPQQSPFGPGLGHDPARMGGRDGRPPLSEEAIIGKRIDLPAEAYKKVRNLSWPHNNPSSSILCPTICLLELLTDLLIGGGLVHSVCHTSWIQL